MSAEQTTKQTPTLTATATATATAILDQARKRLQEATRAQEAAREHSEAARATLAELEAQADRGEAVDTDEYVRAKSDLTLKSRRTSALGAPVAEAQAAVTEAENGVQHAELVDLAKAVPDTIRAHDKAVKAVTEYLTAVTARREAILHLQSVARKQGVPDIPHPSPEGSTGWPCLTFTGNGPSRITDRIGWLLVEGEKFDYPSAKAALSTLTNELTRLAR